MVAAALAGLSVSLELAATVAALVVALIAIAETVGVLIDIVRGWGEKK